MPSRKKSLMFAFAFLTSICSFVIVCLVLATKNWVSSRITFTSGTANTTMFFTYGLFEGHWSTTVVHGIAIQETSFQVSDLLENGPVKSFNIAVVFLLVISLLSSFLSSGFTCYNAVSNPYQTFLGPIGAYTWNSISGICIFLTLILFAVNVEVNELSVQLADKVSAVSRPYGLSNFYGYSYWIMLLIALLNVATIIIVVFYQKERYSKRKEQERPMESAPKDGILF